MIRFRPLGNGFAIFAIALLLITAIVSPLAFTQEKTLQHTEHDKMLQDCAKSCSDCQRACDMCGTHCAHQVHAGKKEHMATLMTCQDCSTFCAAASQILARGGPFAQLICTSCAEACAVCGAECEKFPNDSHMKACAEECRRCEKACRAMAKHAASK